MKLSCRKEIEQTKDLKTSFDPIVVAGADIVAVIFEAEYS